MTRLWAALQSASGGTWGGCVYDTDAIVVKLQVVVGARHAARPTGSSWSPGLQPREGLNPQHETIPQPHAPLDRLGRRGARRHVVAPPRGAGPAGTGAAAPPAGTTPRNVVFILTDDHATTRSASCGAAVLETPNLDALARGGVHLRNAFVTTALCSP